MAFYSVKCEACEDAARHCVYSLQRVYEDDIFAQMYECDNKTCPVNAVRAKGIRQLEIMKLETKRGGEDRARHTLKRRQSR